MYKIPTLLESKTILKKDLMSLSIYSDIIAETDLGLGGVNLL